MDSQPLSPPPWPLHRCPEAPSLSLTFPQIEAIYHTSIVVAGAEYYFGGGINVARAGHTPFGRPIQARCGVLGLVNARRVVSLL